jgi:hypothetical protein
MIKVFSILERNKLKIGKIVPLARAIRTPKKNRHILSDA